MKSKSFTKKQRHKIDVSCRLPEDYPWKVLDKTLQDLKEYLNVDDAVTISGIVRNHDFDGYLALSEEWGLQSISSTDTEIVEIRSKYILASLLKKFQFPTDKEQRVARAKEIFFSAESDCELYNRVGYKALRRPENDWGVEILHHARLFLTKLLGTDLPGSKKLLDRSRHGPGATTDTEGGNISLYHKFSEWPYSCTVNAFRYARFAIETDQRWIGALQNDYRARLGIPKQMPLDMKKFWSAVIKVESANRITFVPKDARKERTIAIEPSLNLFLQLGVDGFIRRRLKRFGVNLDDQTKNQELARLGSMQDGPTSFVTVDLSAASDSLSTSLCETLLPKDWYTYLMDLRCPQGSLEGDLVNYEKISSMGNGYTFALESAIFAALVYAVEKTGGGKFDHRTFAVFGDDIIVQKQYYFQLVEALRLSGFKVNLEKTFVSGPIRESCGTDWFHGLPVRPVFLDKAPTNVTELFCDYNRLKRLLSLRYSLEESEVLSCLLKWVPERALSLRGPLSDEDFDSYLHVNEAPKGLYGHGVYKYKRLIWTPLSRPGKNFLFRKLMHDLRGSPAVPSQKWEQGHKVTSKGSRFTVTSRHAIKVGYTYSVSDYWRSSYAD